MSLVERVLAMLPSTDCVDWPGRINDFGYGHVGYKGKTWKAHRLIYVLVGNEIPPGMQTDHLCRNTRCVNPLHIEPVSARTNSLRSDSPSGRNARKTHCPQGHEYTEDNIYLYRGMRNCRICQKANNLRQTARRRALRAAGRSS